MYLDPGSWSMAVQAMIGFFVAIPVIVGIYWKQIKAYVTRLRNRGR